MITDNVTTLTLMFGHTRNCIFRNKGVIVKTESSVKPKPKMPPMALISFARNFTSALEKLRIKLTPPHVTTIQMLTNYWVSRLLYAAAKIGIADLLVDGPRNIEELATATGMQAAPLYRLLRALASVGVFREKEQHCFELTPLAASLRSDVPGSLRAMALLIGDDINWQSWGDILHSMKTGKPAFENVFGIEYFQYLAQNSETSDIFNKAMTASEARAFNAVAATFDFQSVATIVDVGGGQGTLMIGILKANPQLRGILFDQTHVVADAEQSIKASGVAERCKLVGGNFFESVPTGADAYILSAVIHNWDDDRSLTIFKNCHQAMAENGKLLILEMVIPSGNEPHIGKFLDMQMLLTIGGRERTESEYRELLSKAGFKLTKITQTLSQFSVIEAVKK